VSRRVGRQSTNTPRLLLAPLGVARGKLDGTPISTSSQSAQVCEAKLPIIREYASRLAATGSSGWALQRRDWIRVQSGGSMAVEAIMPKLSKYTPACGQCQQRHRSASSRSQLHVASASYRKMKPWLGPGLAENGARRIEDSNRFELYWRFSVTI